MATLILYFTTADGDAWAWKVEAGSRVIAQSKTTFSCYLDVLADARASGYRQEPTFGPLPPMPGVSDAKRVH